MTSSSDGPRHMRAGDEAAHGPVGVGQHRGRGVLHVDAGRVGGHESPTTRVTARPVIAATMSSWWLLFMSTTPPPACAACPRHGLWRSTAQADAPVVRRLVDERPDADGTSPGRWRRLARVRGGLRHDRREAHLVEHTQGPARSVGHAVEVVDARPGSARAASPPARGDRPRAPGRAMGASRSWGPRHRPPRPRPPRAGRPGSRTRGHRSCAPGPPPAARSRSCTPTIAQHRSSSRRPAPRPRPHRRSRRCPARGLARHSRACRRYPSGCSSGLFMTLLGATLTVRDRDTSVTIR